MSKEKQREEGNREFGRQSFRFPEEKRGFQWLQLFRRSSSPRLSYSRGTVADTRAKVFEVGLKLAYHREGRWGECLPDTVSSTYSRVIRWNLWSTTTRGWTEPPPPLIRKPFHTEFFVNWTNFAPSSPPRGREFHRRRYFDRVSRLIPCENVWTLHASRRISSFSSPQKLMKIGWNTCVWIFVCFVRSSKAVVRRLWKGKFKGKVGGNANGSWQLGVGMKMLRSDETILPVTRPLSTVPISKFSSIIFLASKCNLHQRAGICTFSIIFSFVIAVC